VASHETRKLQVGAGFYALDGWLNTDLVPWSLDYVTGGSIILDAREKFSIPDCTFHYVFTEHQIEHMTYSEGARMLAECYRVLKPGGKIRIATPNLDNILSLCSHENGSLQRAYVQQWIERFHPGPTVAASIVVNDFFRLWGHKFIYDRKTLAHSVELAGFIDVRWYDPGESDDPELTGVESHGRAIGEDMNRFETMVLEATR
jgi:predicted SAM-dependent methyltransferase